MYNTSKIAKVKNVFCDKYIDFNWFLYTCVNKNYQIEM